MAFLDTDKVIQDLNRRFAEPLPEFYKRRIIFWLDEMHLPATTTMRKSVKEQRKNKSTGK